MTFVNLEPAEKKIYSQHGEDGVLQAIFAEIGVTNRYFVEFGVEDATECNTAYLLELGWTGLLMDGEGISRNPRAIVEKEYITAENINELFAKHLVPQHFDLLSIDIDSNDYWVWKALDEFHPRVVVIEYNGSVPAEQRRTIVYDPTFIWSGSDYFGASLRALTELADRKGYELVYCESIGVNAFFIARSELPANYFSRPFEARFRPANYYAKGYGHPPETHRRMIDPDSISPFELAVIQHQSGDPEQAETLYRQIVPSDPSYAESRFQLGILELEAKHFESASELIHQAIALNPQEPTFHYNLGLCLQEMKLLDEAMSSFNQTVRLEPRFVAAYVQRGLILKDQGRFAEAADAFYRVLRYYPYDLVALNNQGNILKKLGRLDEAIQLFRHALSIKPDFSDAYNNMGIVLYLQGKVHEAIECFQKALQIDPSSENLKRNLEVILKKQNQK